MEELNKTNQEQDEQDDDLTEKPLSIGNTRIGTKRGMYNGAYRELSIYYGNYVKPMIGGQFLRMDETAYRHILEDFLNSDEGRKYKIPTEEEYSHANEVVQAKIAKYMASQPAPEAPAEPIKEEDIKPIKDKEEKPEKPRKTKGLYSSLFGSKEEANEPSENAEAKPEVKEETKPEPKPEPAKEEPPQVSKETLEFQERLSKLEEENKKTIRALEKANERAEVYKNKLAIANAPKKQKTTDFLFKAVSIMLIVTSIMSIVVFFLSTYR